MFSLRLWSRSQGSWSQNATLIPRRIRRVPVMFSISPRIALRRVDFPEPTLVAVSTHVSHPLFGEWDVEIRTVQ